MAAAFGNGLEAALSPLLFVPGRLDLGPSVWRGMVGGEEEADAVFDEP